ncbi:5-formaminoimidazole-4-carboxamide-1-(beta)-D-ribofuranosyl 5'-monophosphate synthetase [Sulfodiicoccus acidiphilus]|uniref:5-formaminoimidazole-4-carboxamide-1-(Beta)-D-ribofuranosyl 5'-monophosphate synthetase n=1 Tax=Sulfodiicoccus acidiphilus TaxID=1670455 RepID=A0A348B0C4_9CREN|nr:formate--phosphoribosylaminoimidazolecarboxamide ligase family protein [Sulfodiicoccus acidiphilus]BBD71626.1 5-formaminoimidazole-4-carboxamide-1-(beta)-D-ribofuranosyl 5'-monophosphate synthetase [Sulfodiicoccus acidiphilus]GGT87002.1 5-formaminoimidazole-4-carboxamide-1-(beta)-D-ribofuranosyl 5'-monophosphate synthetase [Sulfodiicoccus acidiphilus]
MRVAAFASHSALDVFDGAKDEGFESVGLCKKGRERPYLEFKEVVDYCIMVEEFKEIASVKIVNELRRLEAVLVPNRSLAVYVGYDSLEKMEIPFFGNKFMLRWEERTGEKNYYRLLDVAKIKRPRTYKWEDKIEGPVLVKIPEAKRKVERGFFFAVNDEDMRSRLEHLVSVGMVDKEDVRNTVIEELILGAHFNVNFFYSPLRERVELHSIDRRIQSDWDGFYRLPADIQLRLNSQPRLIEVGHEPATLRESLLEKIFEIGYSFVKATKELESPGIIGPFTLQLMVTPELELVVYDVAPRIGGGTNAHMGIGSQYSKLYWREPMSVGRRIARELREAKEKGQLKEVTS